MNTDKHGWEEEDEDGGWRMEALLASLLFSPWEDARVARLAALENV